jgi:hypothetical protein
MNNSAFHERLKLLAGFMNTIAATFLSAGFIGPVLAFFYGLAPANTGLALIAVGSTICIAMSVGIRLIGRAVLGRIRE